MSAFLRRHLLILLLTLCGLGLALHLHMTWPDFGGSVSSMGAVQATSDLERLDRRIDTFQAPPLQNFSEIVARPLFSPGRRPPVPNNAEPPPKIVAAPATVPTTGQFRVIGIIIEGDDRRALIKRAQRGEMIQVSEQEQIAGWTVVSIDPESVTFGQLHVTDVVLLRDNVMSQADKAKLQKAKHLQQKKRQIQQKARQLQRLKAQQADSDRRQSALRRKAQGSNSAEQPGATRLPAASRQPQQGAASRQQSGSSPGSKQ